MLILLITRIIQTMMIVIRIVVIIVITKVIESIRVTLVQK